MEDNYSYYISDINNLYEKYHSLSNDELRQRMTDVKDVISSCKDKQRALSENLTIVYALLKETQRRFAVGKVIVTANEYDKRLANEFDFVKIDNTKAIYKNEWNVCGNHFVWNMVPYDVQLLGAVYLHFGYAAEIATGEGKTLIAMFPAFLQALTHKGVHVITSNDYLSQRDFELSRPIYMFHGLTVGCIEGCERNTRQRKNAYKCDITFGYLSTFIFDYLFDHMALRKEECCQLRPYNAAIIDELDSNLIDRAQTPHIISGGEYQNNEEFYKKYIVLIRELLKNPSLYTSEFIEKKAEFTDGGKEWLRNKLDNQYLFRYDKLYAVPNYSELEEEKQDKWKLIVFKQQVLNNLLRGCTVYIKDKDYIVDNRKVVIIDDNTGRPLPATRWGYGLHTAIEVKENVNVQRDSDSLGIISTKNFLKHYKSICGMSGTIEQVKDELNAVYGLKYVSIPTNKPVIRIDRPLRIFKTARDRMDAVVSQIITIHAIGRPILIGCTTVKQNEQLCEILKEQGLPFQQLNAKTLKDEAYVISKAGEYGAITVSTSIAGRGTDIKLSDSAKSAGGLFVIGFEMFSSKRIDRQLSGRAGRQGDPGDSQFYASLEDDMVKIMSKEDRNKIDEYASNINTPEISIDSIRDILEKTQTQNEAESIKKRHELELKDGTIQPFREKFYKERASVLFDGSCAKIILSQLFPGAESIKNKFTTHSLILYHKIHFILPRLIENEYGERFVSVPFSDDRHLFSLTFDIQQLQSSGQYFKDEYVRQNILLIYDKCWTKFMGYCNQNLDRYEISILPQKYDEMRKEVIAILKSRLINASIPIGSKVEEEENLNAWNIPHDHAMACPHTDDLCPCGSGKKYGECHGKITRHKSRR